MNISDLIDSINLDTDENFEEEDVLVFINDGIARINIECNANFPFISEEDVEYTALPKKWIMMLIKPYASAKIKQNDSSQFEYIDYYSIFDNNLSRFKQFYEIPDEYKDEEAIDRVTFQDFSNHPFRWS